ncbi:recombinase family protein [Bradyrhizobium sp. 146]|uniref:recombinase family protein n=1 Tax=Bradyrhizobium sp. 146 TaxID=2782622 RepID=UPI001FF8202F|nr:recombinase family protein [Bradyrhizobium sp. 146]MCK1705027.1 recombinase family protein [Bradyrhizobium sp. 146]
MARNNRDWHQLLELCSVFGVLIADGERLYDPRAYHDRLLLGLSGIMSEAELHQLRMRLHQGERQKAARGELRLPLPAGLAYGRAGTVILNPDEEVQARLHLVFAKFQELQSARRVMRYLDRNGLSLPVRPLLGPAPHETVWRVPDSARVLSILQNPAYAGAYVYGRRQKDPSRCQSGSLTGTVKVAIADWAVCLRAAHPGYIGWEEFMANQRRLADNVAHFEAGHAGVPRKGAALLQGIAICGRCGRRMSMRYTGPNADYPVYCCRSDRDQEGSALCQEVRALAVDALVQRVVLDALLPDQIEIALAAATFAHPACPLIATLRHVYRPQLSAEAAANLRLLMVLQAKNRQVVRGVIGRVFVDVVDLDGLARRVANATSAIVLVQHFGRDLVWNWRAHELLYLRERQTRL